MSSETAKKYQAYFREDYLQKILHLNLVANGGPIDKLQKIIGDYETDKIVNRY